MNLNELKEPSKKKLLLQQEMKPPQFVRNYYAGY
jgi:hypothetical protein